MTQFCTIKISLTVRLAHGGCQNGVHGILLLHEAVKTSNCLEPYPLSAENDQNLMVASCVLGPRCLNGVTLGEVSSESELESESESESDAELLPAPKSASSPDVSDVPQ
jgi:hypothetical protein